MDRSDLRSKSLVLGLLLALCGLAEVGCMPGVPQSLPGIELTEQRRELLARRSLVEARQLIEQGRLDSALRATGRGLRYQPHDAKLHRLRAEILEDLGRPSEARLHEELALQHAPPSSPLSDEPMIAAGDPDGFLVILLPPPSRGDPDGPWATNRVPESWPAGEAAERLQERIAVRFPGAAILVLDRGKVESSVTSVPEVLRWLGPHIRSPALSLRLDRAFCDESTSDGPFAVAWLRAGYANGLSPALAVEQVRVVIEDPSDCQGEVVARALEAALAVPRLKVALETSEAGPEGVWSNREVRGLFPRLDLMIEQDLDRGRKAIRAGQLAAAREHLQRALEIDPDNQSAGSMLNDVESSIRLSQELSRRSNSERKPDQWHHREAPSLLQDSLSSEEARRTELQLREEKRRRDSMLAVISALEDSERAPGETVLSELRPSEIRDPDAQGPRLASRLTDADIDSRTLYGPDGGLIARYYFAEGSEVALLRETDETGDGHPDHWVAYSQNERREAWKDDKSSGAPRLHMVYAEGGADIERVEIDANRSGIPNQVYHYREGQLEREARDTSGDGRLDCFEEFDAEGEVSVREEDVDGDGTIDMRTRYRSGRILSREILNPVALDSVE